MFIATELAHGFAPSDRAWFVKCAIQGFALGCFPAFKEVWNLPPLFQSGVVFRLPPEHGSGLEHMRLPLYTYQDGWGDCDRLLIWWLCEQWAQGKPASCTAWFQGGNVHVAGRRSWNDTGPIVDPSIVLGAPTPPGWPPKVPLIRSYP